MTCQPNPSKQAIFCLSVQIAVIMSTTFSSTGMINPCTTTDNMPILRQLAEVYLAVASSSVIVRPLCVKIHYP